MRNNITVPAIAAVAPAEAAGLDRNVYLLVTYCLLALVATVCNIAAQDAAIRLYSGPFSVHLALMFGTGVGLVVKYLCDKRFIFQFKADDISHDTRTFLLYALMGVSTTAIFWGMELGFDYAFGTKEMRYLGGSLGLALGYFTKYHLDKRFVFKQRNA